jgi:hypothetical protein
MLDYRPVAYENIPDIELYMDQVMGFLTRELGIFSENTREMILTKSMVNNYVKAGILQKPAKKKYNQDHLSQMIMLYFLKNVITMEETQTLINHGDSPKDLYETFRKIQGEVYLEGQRALDRLETEESRLEVIFHLLIQADINKRIAKALIKEL